MNLIKLMSLITLLAPLLGSLLAGLAGRQIGKKGSHWITIILMSISFVSAISVLEMVIWNHQSFNGTLYTWGSSGSFQFNLGFLIDPLSVVMMALVTFVSLLVHLYSVGYMAEDPSNQRFFSYVSLFTFFMLLLVTANNFLQLFFGWEGVGLVSYLLIGFWFSKESAASGSLKAFIVNRIGDFAFILGIAAIHNYFNTLDYASVFDKASSLVGTNMAIFPGTYWMVLTVICVLLFVGAMAKSAQVPLHIWLPESMEGPTPISALIHAATMVTAGVFMVARMSPLFELSQTALTMILVVGSTGALFLGLLAFVENDIKRIIAYSTMSQLGYMMAANGASAFSAGIFHLLTHGCFKALLFLSAGSVIVAMHHEQDLRNMGGLRKYLPITYLCFLVGAISLAAIPPFSGYFSKEAVIEAVRLSYIPGAHYAYYCLLAGSFVTAFYIFRAFFMAFHGKERMDEKLRRHLKESHWTLLTAMVSLAIPSICLGGIMVHSILYETPGLLGKSIYISPQFDVLADMAGKFHGVMNQTYQAFTSTPFWFALSGVFFAWLVVIRQPACFDRLSQYLSIFRLILTRQYGLDWFSDTVVARGSRGIADFFFKTGDSKIIDHFLINGSGRGVTWMSNIVRRMQSGYLYHYAFVMILGLLGLLWWLIW
jgi:NADH-quinone oxidoreductase subunit L